MGNGNIPDEWNTSVLMQFSCRENLEFESRAFYQ